MQPSDNNQSAVQYYLVNETQNSTYRRRIARERIWLIRERHLMNRSSLVEVFLAFVVVVVVVHRGGERRSAHLRWCLRRWWLRAQAAAANCELRALGVSIGAIHGRWSRVPIILCCDDGGWSLHLASLHIVFLLGSGGSATVANDAHHQDQK